MTDAFQVMQMSNVTDSFFKGIVYLYFSITSPQSVWSERTFLLNPGQFVFSLDSQERQSECFFCVSRYYQCGLFSLAREIMTGPNSIVTSTLINCHRQSSMAPFFDCENPASLCMNGKKKKMTHK